MKPMTTYFLISSCATLFAACAQIPESTTPKQAFATLSCEALDQELKNAQETERVASEARAKSWNVVLPVAVVVRYENADSAVKTAEDRAAALHTQMELKKCAQPEARCAAGSECSD